MFDKLIEFIIHFIGDILPFTVVNQWEMGVYLRLGKFKKVVNAGLILKIPFADKVWTHEVITQTVHLQPQTLTTLDDKSIVLKSIIRYHVNDVKKFLLHVMRASDVLVDTTQGVIRDKVEYTNWEDLDDICRDLETNVQNIVDDWGITIERITLTDLGIVRTYRVMSDTKPITNTLGNENC
jgi:regulator of protease activity HflC (stomatin/prohibitin superfamily)